MIQCFKMKKGTEYAKAVEQYFELRPKWKGVFQRLNDYLGENIKSMRLDPAILEIETNDLTKEENKKLFTKDGRLKKNSNEAKELGKIYKSIISDLGLSIFKSLSYINFCYGVMRMSGEELESYTDDDGVIYFKADFDLVKRSGNAVEPITEIEYQEHYLELIKNKSAIRG